MTITPSDLAVGQVWAFGTGVRNIDELDVARDLVGFGWRYTGPDGASYREHSCACSFDEFVSAINTRGAYLASPFTPIPHPSALGDLYDVAKLLVLAQGWPGDSEAWPELYAAARSAIRKAGGVA